MTYHTKPRYHELDEIVATRIGEDQVHSMIPVDYDPMAHGRMHNAVETFTDWPGMVSGELHPVDDFGI